VLVLLSVSQRAFGQPPARLSAIAVATRGQEAVVTISAAGPLPEPSAGVAAAPPRIYLDFPNVRPPAFASAASTDPRIRRVRVAVHSATPLVTRVVIDLTSPQPYRIDRTTAGLIVIVGARAEAPASVPAPPAPQPSPPSAPPPPSTPRADPPRAFRSAPSSIPPVPQLPPPASPGEAPRRAPAAMPSPAQPTVQPNIGPPPQPLPAKDLDRYRKQVGALLERLRMQEPLLKALDASEEQTPERMLMAADEFERLRQELTTIKPPETLIAQHAMLVQSSTLAIMATTLRTEASRTGDVSVRKNAASAAAGALLLLQRACGDLKCN